MAADEWLTAEEILQHQRIAVQGTEPEGEDFVLTGFREKEWEERLW